MAVRFDLCERTASMLLLEQDINRSSVNVSSLKYEKNVIFDTFVHYCICSGISVKSFDKTNKLKDGFLLKYGDTYLILGDKTACTPRQNWTWAHEVGHIYLGHTCDGPEQEREANCFASQLLMPWCVVRHLAALLHGVTAHDLADVFGVSLTAGTNRVNALRKKRDFPYSRIDAELLRKYIPHLQDYVKNAV
jgi:Zn-dependent peptidase ImmA (M78 family)